MLLLLPAFVVFAPGLHYPFLGVDDLHHVVQNPALRDLSWRGIRFLFLEDTRDLRYLPLTYLSLAIDMRLWGDNPFGFHLTNLLLHMANTLLVFELVRRLFEDRLAAAVAALLFSIHPVQVESVAWVISRRNVLFLFFFLLSVWTYLGVARSSAGVPSAAPWRVRGALLASVVLYALACLSRVAAITLPAVLVLIDLVLDPARRPALGAFLRRSLPNKLAYLPVLAACFALSWKPDAPNPFARAYAFTPFEWAAIVGHNLFFYVTKVVVPTDLGWFYALPEPGALPAHFTAFTLGAVALAILVVWAFFRGAKGITFGLGWYLVTILPLAIVLFFFRDLPLLAADRYAYQSIIGLFVLAGLAASRLWENTRYRVPLGVLGATLVLSLMVAASEHRSAWRSTIALYEKLLEGHPTDEFQYRLALEYAAAGRQADAFAALEAAEAAPHRIFFMDFLYYRLRIAGLYVAKGDPAGAAAQVSAGLRAVPNAYEPDARADRLGFEVLADLYRRAGDGPAAHDARTRAEPLEDAPDQYFLRMWTHASPGQARAWLERQVTERPRDGRAWHRLAQQAALAGDASRATAARARARALGHPPGGRGP